MGVEPPQQTPDKTSAGWNGRRRDDSIGCYLNDVAARAMMDGKDEQKWEVMHALARAKEACGHLDRAEHLLRQGILQSLRFLAPGCWLARARVYRTHQITPDERRAPRSRPLTREQSAAPRVRALNYGSHVMSCLINLITWISNFIIVMSTDPQSG